MAVRGLVRRKSASEILLEAGLIGNEKIQEAEKFAQLNKISLLDAFSEGEFIPKGVLLESLAKEWQVKTIDLSGIELDEEIVKIIPEPAARRYRAVAFAKEGKTLSIAMADPWDFFAVEDIALRSGFEVIAYLASPQDIVRAFEKIYGKVEAVNRMVAEMVNKEAPLESPEGFGFEAPRSDIAEIDVDAPEIEKIVNAIILTAVSLRASDIHIEPFEDPAGKNSKIIIRYRVDGTLLPGPFTVPWNYRNAISAKIKIMTNSMNITERRVPQSGRIQVLAEGRPLEFRVEMVPTVYGESCVMRILDRKAVQVDIQKMGFLPETLEKFTGILKGIGGKKNYGLVLLSGPTGSGKSTTLYGALNYINRPDIKILTAENPVEYNLDGIVQVPVNPDIKLGEGKKFDFASALRSFLRLDPDVIMVGEIRDEETAKVAMEAAMTGHLVFSTIHTNDSIAAILRLIEMGIPSFMVATTIKAVLAQRLSRRLCPECKTPHAPTTEETQIFKDHKVDLPSNIQIYGPPPVSKCSACNSLGFKGRLGIHELLLMSENLRSLALRESPADLIRQEAVKEGLKTLVQDGLEKVKAGLTTVREVLGGVEND
jgi:type IV pilus assembly protein PilB